MCGALPMLGLLRVLAGLGMPSNGGWEGLRMPIWRSELVKSSLNGRRQNGGSRQVEQDLAMCEVRCGHIERGGLLNKGFWQMDAGLWIVPG